VSEKRAYYLEFTDKGFAVVIKDDGEKQTIWTAETPDADAFIAQLHCESYEIIAYISAAYKNKRDEEARPRRKWHPLDVNSDQVHEHLKNIDPMVLMDAPSLIWRAAPRPPDAPAPVYIEEQAINVQDYVGRPESPSDGD
jgi:hypothetical protein